MHVAVAKPVVALELVHESFCQLIHEVEVAYYQVVLVRLQAEEGRGRVGVSAIAVVVVLHLCAVLLIINL